VQDQGGLWLRKPEGIQGLATKEVFEKVYYLRQKDRAFCHRGPRQWQGSEEGCRVYVAELEIVIRLITHS
jgi:hypothetical protein